MPVTAHIHFSAHFSIDSFSSHFDEFFNGEQIPRAESYKTAKVLAWTQLETTRANENTVMSTLKRQAKNPTFFRTQGIITLVDKRIMDQQ